MLVELIAPLCMTLQSQTLPSRGPGVQKGLWANEGSIEISKLERLV